MRKTIAIVGLVLGFLLAQSAYADGFKPAPAKKHATVKLLKGAALVVSSPVVHPKRSLKQVLGSVLFAVEPVVDVSSVALQALDKGASLELRHSPFEYPAKAFIKLDSGIERAEDFLFGNHN